jgi:hypothetical protein
MRDDPAAGDLSDNLAYLLCLPFFVCSTTYIYSLLCRLSVHPTRDNTEALPRNGYHLPRPDGILEGYTSADGLCL